MKRILILGLIAVLMLAFTGMSVISQIPQTLNYQGYLYDGTTKKALDGTYNLTVKIYDVATAGTDIFNQIFSNQLVSGGYFNVVLTNVNLTFDKQYWVSVQVGTDPEFPRTVMTSVPYAFNSNTSTVADSARAANSSVTANTANTASIANTVVDGAITLNKLATEVKTAGGDLTGFYPNPTIKPKSITKGMLMDDVLSGLPTGEADGEVYGDWKNLRVRPGAPNRIYTTNGLTNQWQVFKLGNQFSGDGVANPVSITGTVPTANTAVSITGNLTGPVTSTGMVTTITPAADPTWITSLAGSKITGAVANATNANVAITFSGNLTGSVTSTGMATTITPAADPTWITSLAGSKITGAVANATTSVNFTGNLTGPVTSTGMTTTITPAADPAWITSLAGAKITGTVANATTSVNFSGNLTGPVTSTGMTTTITPAADPTWITALAGAKITGTVANATNATNASNLTGNLSGQVTSVGMVTTIANDAVTSAKILDGTIVAADLGANSVTTAKIADGAVLNAKIPNNEITGAKFQDNSITNAKIQNNAVTEVKISDNAITSAKINDNTIATVDLAPQCVTNAKLAFDAVTSVNILNGEVTTAKINPSTFINQFLITDGGGATNWAGLSIGTTLSGDGITTALDVADEGITNAKVSSIFADRITGSKIDPQFADQVVASNGLHVSFGNTILDGGLQVSSGKEILSHGVASNNAALYTAFGSKTIIYFSGSTNSNPVIASLPTGTLGQVVYVTFQYAQSSAFGKVVAAGDMLQFIFTGLDQATGTWKVK